jgi:malate permease and related proteins
VTLVALAIVAATTIGVLGERRYGERAHALSRLLMGAVLWVVLPFVTFFVVANLELDAGVGAGLGLGYVVMAVVGALAYLAGTRVLGLRREQTGALMVVCVMANTGYLGLPLCAALLGTGALAPAIAFDAVVSMPMFIGVAFMIGAAFGTRAGATRGERARSFLVRNPPLLALIAALVAPDALAPEVMVGVAETVVFSILPVGFFVLGVSLAAEAQGGALAFPPPLTPAVGAAVLLRVVVAPLLLLALAAVTVALPDAYHLQAAMPSGINALVVAHAFGLDLRLTSAAIAWTTTLVVVGALVAGFAT